MPSLQFLRPPLSLDSIPSRHRASPPSSSPFPPSLSLYVPHLFLGPPITIFFPKPERLILVKDPAMVTTSEKPSLTPPDEGLASFPVLLKQWGCVSTHPSSAYTVHVSSSSSLTSQSMNFHCTYHCIPGHGVVPDPLQHC